MTEYVIRKNGYFYRPNARGYTASIHEAGRFTPDDARAYVNGAEGVTMHEPAEFAAAFDKALSEPDFTVDDSEVARRILSKLGIASEPSLDPGIDHRRDWIAAILCKALSEPPAAHGFNMPEPHIPQYPPGATGTRVESLDAMLREQFRRRAPVEEALQQIAKGKRRPLTQEEAARFAALIGVPDEYRDKALSEPPAVRETVWLVERDDWKPGQTHYYCGSVDGKRSSWTPDVHQARKFATKTQAEVALGASPAMRVREHVFGLHLSEPPAALAEIEGLVERLRVNMHAYGICQEAATALEALSARVGEALDWRDAMINKNRDLQEALNASIYNYGSITRERHDALARVAQLEAALDLYREAVRIDVKMEGPQFMGSNTSALKRAWEHDRAALSTEAKAQGGKNG